MFRFRNREKCSPHLTAYSATTRLKFFVFTRLGLSPRFDELDKTARYDARIFLPDVEILQIDSLYEDFIDHSQVLMATLTHTNWKGFANLVKFE